MNHICMLEQTYQAWIYVWYIQYIMIILWEQLPFDQVRDWSSFKQDQTWIIPYIQVHLPLIQSMCCSPTDSPCKCIVSCIHEMGNLAPKPPHILAREWQITFPLGLVQLMGVKLLLKHTPSLKDLLCWTHIWPWSPPPPALPWSVLNQLAFYRQQLYF